MKKTIVILALIILTAIGTAAATSNYIIKNLEISGTAGNYTATIFNQVYLYE